MKHYIQYIYLNRRENLYDISQSFSNVHIFISLLLIDLINFCCFLKNYFLFYNNSMLYSVAGGSFEVTLQNSNKQQLPGNNENK